jgi:hypothetical protein
MQKKANPKIGAVRSPDVVLGRCVKRHRGTRFAGGREVVLPRDQLRQNVVILGGDTDEEHLVAPLLIAAAMEDPDAQVLCFSGGCSMGVGEGFEEAARRTKRELFFFPAQHFDAWRQLPAEYWLRDLIRSADLAVWQHSIDIDQILYLACDLGCQQVRSAEELLANLDYGELQAAYDDDRMLSGITCQHVETLRTSFQKVFRQSAGAALSGTESFTDLDCAYFSFDWRGKTVMRMLLRQLLTYVREEKDPDRPCTVFIDLPDEGDVYPGELMESARHHGITLVWIVPTQALALRRGPQMAQLLDGAGTLIVQSHAAWHEVRRLMGLARRGRGAGRRFASIKQQITEDDLFELRGERVLVMGKDGETLVESPRRGPTFEYLSGLAPSSLGNDI